MKNRRRTIDKLKTELTQGMIQGKSFQQTSKAVADVMNNSISNAQRIVRTESMRAMNAGSFANYNAALSVGADLYRQILATLDTRTRQQSQEVDGRTDKDHPGYFLYPGGVKVAYPGNSGVAGWDINDRERSINVVPGHEPNSRRGRNPVTERNEIMTFRDFPAWARENGLRKSASGKYVFAGG